MQRLRNSLLLALLICLATAGLGLAASTSTSFALHKHVLGAAGGTTHSPAYRLAGTWMPTAAGYSATSHGSDLCAGFWLGGGRDRCPAASAPQPASKLSQIYLPQLTFGQADQSGPAPLPDLLVSRVQVAGDHIQVVILNQGQAAVTRDNPFWVDLYLDPQPAPTAVNQVWGDGRCTYGAVWGIAGEALPLEPGQSLTLERNDAYYWPGYSHLPWPVPAGQVVYVQVDSASTQHPAYGAILESHEADGGTYNNILGPVLSAAEAGGLVSVQSAPVTALREAGSMPPRPDDP